MLMEEEGRRYAVLQGKHLKKSGLMEHREVKDKVMNKQYWYLLDMRIKPKGHYVEFIHSVRGV